MVLAVFHHQPAYRKFANSCAVSAGAPWDNSIVDGSLQLLLDKAGLPKMGFHGLRHSCASLMVA